MQRAPRIVRLLPFVLAAVMGATLAPGARAQPAAVVVGPGLGSNTAPASPAARASSQAAVRALQSTSPNAHAVWRLGQAGPSVVTGLQEQTRGDGAVARARSFVEGHEALLGVAAQALRVTGARASGGRTVVDFQQTLAGSDVHGRTLAVTLDDAGRVFALSNDLSPIGDVAAATISLDDAKATALAAVGAKGGSAGRTVVVANARGAFEAAVFLVARAGSLDAVEVVVNLHDGSVSSILSAVRQ